MVDVVQLNTTEVTSATVPVSALEQTSPATATSGKVSSPPTSSTAIQVTPVSYTIATSLGPLPITLASQAVSNPKAAHKKSKSAPAIRLAHIASQYNHDIPSTQSASITEAFVSPLANNRNQVKASSKVPRPLVLNPTPALEPLPRWTPFSCHDPTVETPTGRGRASTCAAKDYPHTVRAAGVPMPSLVDNHVRNKYQPSKTSLASHPARSGSSGWPMLPSSVPATPPTQSRSTASPIPPVLTSSSTTCGRNNHYRRSISIEDFRNHKGMQGLPQAMASEPVPQIPPRYRATFPPMTPKLQRSRSMKAINHLPLDTSATPASPTYSYLSLTTPPSLTSSISSASSLFSSGTTTSTASSHTATSPLTPSTQTSAQQSYYMEALTPISCNPTHLVPLTPPHYSLAKLEFLPRSNLDKLNLEWEMASSIHTVTTDHERRSVDSLALRQFTTPTASSGSLVSTGGGNSSERRGSAHSRKSARRRGTMLQEVAFGPPTTPPPCKPLPQLPPGVEVAVTQNTAAHSTTHAVPQLTLATTISTACDKTAAKAELPHLQKPVQQQIKEHEVSYFDLSSDDEDLRKESRPASIAVWRRVKKALGMKQKIKETEGSDWEAGSRPVRKSEAVL
jgi:hypothetical protein